MEATTFSNVTLQDLPKPGETLHLEGFISKHADGTLTISGARTSRGVGIAAWAQVWFSDTDAVIILDESHELFSVAVENLEWERTQRNYGNVPDIYKATTTVVRYNSRDEHPFYHGG